MAYQGTDFGRFILGTDDSIDRNSREDILAYYRRMFVSGRMVLVASGEISINKLVNFAERDLLMPEGPKPDRFGNLPVIRNSEVVIEPNSSTKQVDLVLGFRTISAFHEDGPALNVLAQILGGGRTSSLIKKLRYEKGWVYGVSVTSSRHDEAGDFHIKTSTSKDHLTDVMTVITDEIKRVVDSGPTSDEVLFVQNKIVKSLRTGLQTSASWTDFHSYYDLTEQTPYGLREFTQGIINVTPEKIHEVAQKYFGKDKWYLAMCGDVSSKDVIIRL